MTSALHTRAETQNIMHAGTAKGSGNSPLSRTSIPHEVTDCHAAEHLLVGTHNVDESGSMPVCLTCRYQGIAA